VGSSDPSNRAYLERVERLIEQVGMRARVIWTDYLPEQEVTAALCASDVCVLPYRDGASTRRGTLMAALAHALPIVTTVPQVAVPRFVDGENMLLAERRDPTALAAAMARLADDPVLRARLSAGAAELSRHFGWPAIAQQTVGFYQELLHDKRH
jgi:glycosyltransferase involved in cell wall biosynthesis